MQQVKLGTETDINAALFYAVNNTWYRDRHQHSYVLCSNYILLQRQLSIYLCFRQQMSLGTEADINIAAFYLPSDTCYRDRLQYIYVLWSRWHLVQTPSQYTCFRQQMSLGTEADINIAAFYLPSDTCYRERLQYIYVLCSRWHLVQRQTSIYLRFTH
jgi:hypothetical protein